MTASSGSAPHEPMHRGGGGKMQPGPLRPDWLKTKSPPRNNCTEEVVAPSGEKSGVICMLGPTRSALSVLRV